MPRSNRPRGSKKIETEAFETTNARMGLRREELKRGVSYTVQTSVGANAEDGKSWICPHCNLAINKGLSHLVAWDSVRGVDTRRHFHSACWNSFQGSLL